jgi:uncharacterized membrane protein
LGIPSELLPGWILGTALVIYGVGMLAACWAAPWRSLRNPTLLNLVLGSTIGLASLWQMRAGLQPGLTFHFLAVTTVTLMLGWSLTVIITGFAELAITLLLGGPLIGVALDGILAGLLPASITFLLYRLYRARLPNHLFVYIFAVAFFGGAMVAVLSVFTRVGLLALVGTYTPERLMTEFLPFLPLYAFPEAVINGMLVTIFSVFRPGWMKTLHESTVL